MGIVTSMFSDEEEQTNEMPEEEKHEDDEPIEVFHIVPNEITGFSPTDFATIPELNIKKLKLLMRHLNYEINEGKINYDLWLDLYSEWLKYMKHLGPYVARGFKDVEEKMNCIRRNRELLCNKLKFFDKTEDYYTSLFSFIYFERNCGLVNFNSCNNSDLFPDVVEGTKNDGPTRITSEMEHLFKDYQSTARTTLRWAWFTDFTGFLCRDYTKNKDLSMTQVA